MTDLRNKNFIRKILAKVPLMVLFLSVLNNYDFNYLELKYFSFNFSYILIFYYSVKKSKGLGYGLIFIAGLFNDAVVGIPIGISSLSYLILCGAAAYLRNITLRPSLMKDWIFFLISLFIVNSISFLILTLIFNYEISFLDQIINIIFTFLFFPFFSYIFSFIEGTMIGRVYVK